MSLKVLWHVYALEKLHISGMLVVPFNMWVFRNKVWNGEKLIKGSQKILIFLKEFDDSLLLAS